MWQGIFLVKTTYWLWCSDIAVQVPSYRASNLSNLEVIWNLLYLLPHLRTSNILKWELKLKVSSSTRYFRLSTHYSFFLFSRTLPSALFQPSQILSSLSFSKIDSLQTTLPPRDQLIIFQSHPWIAYHLSFVNFSFLLFSLLFLIFHISWRVLSKMSQLLLIHGLLHLLISPHSLQFFPFSCCLSTLKK